MISAIDLLYYLSSDLRGDLLTLEVCTDEKHRLNAKEVLLARSIPLSSSRNELD